MPTNARNLATRTIQSLSHQKKRHKETEEQISDHEYGLRKSTVPGLERFLPIPLSPSKQGCRLARGTKPITAKHNVAGCSLQMHFNSISSDDPEARCHWLLNNFLEATSGHCGNYLYVRPLKDMSTHGTSRQPAP